MHPSFPDLAQGYADAVNGGGGPDLVLAPTWWLTDFVSVGVVQPLDELVTPNEIAQYYPATVDNLRWQGTLYGLPTNFELVSLFVNRALADPANAPATMDALLAQAQITTTQGIGLYNSLYHLFWGIPAYGGQLFDDQGVAMLDQTGNTAGYLQWLKEISKTPGSFIDTDYGMLLDRFQEGANLPTLSMGRGRSENCGRRLAIILRW
ncbi:MAG: extracellular solute-binding protein [Anaerolineales bacterium]|nr:extracellular solute-binding protein [Anaerolineales bacterium]